MDKHLEWIVKKTAEAKKADDVVPIILEMDRVMKDMSNSELRDIVLYLVGQVNMED